MADRVVFIAGRTIDPGRKALSTMLIGGIGQEAEGSR